MNITRGLIAGVLGIFAGLILPVLLVGSYLLLTWYFNETFEMDRRADIAYWRKYGMEPLTGCAIYQGLTAWATYTPKRNYGFAKTLAILFFCSMALMVFINILYQSPPQPRSANRDYGLSLSGFLFLLIPPLIVACVLIAVRRAGTKETEPESEPVGQENAL
ncbi:hypothetical protein Pan241w_48490 [Gimesia alba]|uniref:Uncharacterized protein n=1 Tax=Gimesia alba TaxID=2527973 RepID=A0A517RLH9_9PLAN|nr:hypothetical protein [Gimesia alba]QDT44733.1 hypothetical protein Pan241w_48490 [Gimesia alba]